MISAPPLAAFLTRVGVASRRSSALAVMIAALALAACGHRMAPGMVAQTRSPVVDAVASADRAFPPAPYLLGPGDQLDLRYPYHPEFDTTVTVRPDGQITAMLLGPVTAAGLTPEGITQQLRGAYRALADQVPPPSRRAYLIQAGDLLDIRFTDAKDLNDQAIVRPDGRITLAVIGSAIAEGKTPEQLARELIARYAEHLTQAELVVIVRAMANKQYVADGQVRNSPVSGLDDVAAVVRGFPPPRVYVGGEVLRPGEQPYSGQISLLQAVISAGGATSDGEMRSVAVMRRSDAGTPRMFIVDVKSDVQGGMSSDIPLHPFDVVYVPKTRIAVVQDFLDRYLYRIIPALRNSSVGFSYIVAPPIK